MLTRRTTNGVRVARCAHWPVERDGRQATCRECGERLVWTNNPPEWLTIDEAVQKEDQQNA